MPLPPLALPPTVKVLTPVALLATVPVREAVSEISVLTTPLWPLRSKRPPFTFNCMPK